MEFVIAFPPWLLLVLGIMQFSMVAIARLVVLYAASAGARAALVAGSDPKQMQEAAEQAARQVCALVIQVDESSAGRRSIPGWGQLPGSGSVDDLVTVPFQASISPPLSSPTLEAPQIAEKIADRKPIVMASLLPIPSFKSFHCMTKRRWLLKAPPPPPSEKPLEVPPSSSITEVSVDLTPISPPASPVATGAIYIEDKKNLPPPEIWNDDDMLLHIRVEMEFPLIIPLVNALIGHRKNQKRLYWNPFASGGLWGNKTAGGDGGRISGYDNTSGLYYISLSSDVQMVRPFNYWEEE